MTDDLLDRLTEWEREADDYERKAQALRQIIAGVRALNGDADAILNSRSFEAHRTLFETRSPEEGAPRGRDAVRQLMGEQPERVWKVVDIKRELLRRGWSPTPKAVEAAVKRLAALGELETVRYGYYKLARQEQPGDEITEPTSLQGKEDEAR